MCNQTILFKQFPKRDHIIIHNWYSQNVSNVLLIYWFIRVVRFLRWQIEFVAKLILISVWWISFQTLEFRLMFTVLGFVRNHNLWQTEQYFSVNRLKCLIFDDIGLSFLPGKNSMKILPRYELWISINLSLFKCKDHFNIQACCDFLIQLLLFKWILWLNLEKNLWVRS